MLWPTFPLHVRFYASQVTVDLLVCYRLHHICAFRRIAMCSFHCRTVLTRAPKADGINSATLVIILLTTLCSRHPVETSVNHAIGGLLRCRKTKVKSRSFNDLSPLPTTFHRVHHKKIDLERRVLSFATRKRPVGNETKRCCCHHHPKPLYRLKLCTTRGTDEPPTAVPGNDFTTGDSSYEMTELENKKERLPNFNHENHRHSSSYCLSKRPYAEK